jgi:hypothetical protein
MPDIAMIDANANADPDPNAASGSGSGSGSGGADNTDNAEDADDARKKRTERTWPLALTTAGMTWLAKYVHNTFFGKKIAAFDDAEGYVIVTARQEVRGEFTIKTLAIGSNAAMQAKADEALATIHDETIQDEVEGARQVVVLAPPVEYVLRSRLEDRRKDAKEILEVMWRDKFDDVFSTTVPLALASSAAAFASSRLRFPFARLPPLTRFVPTGLYCTDIETPSVFA